MLYVSEASSRLVSLDAAIDAVERAFSAEVSGQAEVFSVATARGFDDRQRWAVKSGLDRSSQVLGFKVGSYWPDNVAAGLLPHASTTVLLDPATGFPLALIAASHLTTMRTAAADAVAVKYLARSDASVLAVVGTGHQALWDVLAIARVRSLSQVLVVGRDPGRLATFVQTLRSKGFTARAADIEDAVQRADIVVTATPARTPVLESEWITPGTHVSAMGADSPGKQELPLDLLRRAALFCDIRAQAVSIGEFQTGVHEGLIAPDDIIPIGLVISGDAQGRTDPAAITIFDSSGMALQDLAVCSLALRLAKEVGEAVELGESI